MRYPSKGLGSRGWHWVGAERQERPRAEAAAREVRYPSKGLGSRGWPRVGAKRQERLRAEAAAREVRYPSEGLASRIGTGLGLSGRSVYVRRRTCGRCATVARG